MHKSRTQTAGKDYLLKAYLEEVTSEDDKKLRDQRGRHRTKKKKSTSSTSAEALGQLVDGLKMLFDVNERLTDAEARANDLEADIAYQRRSRSADDLESTKAEVTRMRGLNERVDREIEANKEFMTSMRTSLDEKRAIVERLEEDLGHVEVEGERLRRVLELEEPPSTPQLEVGDDDLDLLLDFRLSASQLYESNSLMTTKKATSRIKATGSPGSGSNSSSGCGGSEKSVRFQTATPELPPLPFEDESIDGASAARSRKRVKSILKSVDPSGDLDSNSDTGLSSLHSSSDEGTYVLDTLV